MVHIEAIICTLGVVGIPLLTKSLLQFVKEQLENTLTLRNYQRIPAMEL